MKKTTIAFSLAMAFFATSCDKKLDIDPLQSVDASIALTTPTDVQSAVIGTYAIMGGGALYGTNLVMLPDLLASEGYATWRGTFQGPRDVASKSMTRDNSEASRTWTAAYRAINVANNVLEALPIVTDAAQKQRIEGEALWVRGIMHFELVRLYALPWGASAANDHLGVPIATKAVKTETQSFTQAPRNTVAQVYAAVIADLTAAASKLPTDNGTRADKFTALAFMARVYLQQGDYAKALDAANQVILSNKYATQASLLAVFENKNTNESIFEIQQNDQYNAGTSNDGLATFYASLPGIGRADVRVTAAFPNSYPAGDLRRQDWYYVGTGARPGNLYSGKWRTFSQNLPIIRITEMYLTRAECNLRLGSAVGDTPANDLAKVRNPQRTNLAVIAAPTLGAVLSERFWELAFEGHRIHDFKRLKMKTGDFDWNSDRLVLPIPDRDVQASSGTLVQNPGY